MQKRFDILRDNIDTTTPAVVLKVGHHLSLGVIRTLGRLGIPVYAIDSDTAAPGLHSLYCKKRFHWDVDAPPEATVEFLLNLGRSIGRKSLLIHTADELSEMVAQYYSVLSEWYLLPQQDPALVKTLTSKKEMYHLVKKHAIPTAETLFPRSRDEVVAFLAGGMTLPVMMKGIDGLLLEKRTGHKMRIARTKEEVLHLYDTMEDPSNPNIMLQEYIPGGDDTVWMLDGYFNRNSDCLMAITAKKIRQAPIYTGYTSLGICLENETVRQMTIRFMKEIGYRGILDIGYRYDARDGKYKVLDINPRVGATFRLFVSPNGMDVVRAEYLDLTGQPVPEATNDVGRKWIVEERDIMSCIRYYRAGKLTFREWLNSFKGVQELAWFAADDPLPFTILLGRLILTLPRRAVRLFGLLFRRTATHPAAGA
jgi:D-aspartate ligase